MKKMDYCNLLSDKNWNSEYRERVIYRKTVYDKLVIEALFRPKMLGLYVYIYNPSIYIYIQILVNNIYILFERRDAIVS